MADIFQKFLSGLRSQSSQVRLRTARDLRHYIESEYRDLSYAIYMKMVTDISSKIMELCNSSDSLDRMAGIIAMDELVELFIAERNDQIIIEFAHSLSKIFEKIPSADASTLRAASKALGHIVSTGGTSLIEFVEEYHMKPALVWLENDTFQVRRHAGVMILKELAINAPSIFYRHVDKYFDVIWSAFWDSKVVVRVSGSESLLACFALIQQRESNRKSLWYARTLDEVDRGILRNNSDATHGTLLIINELLRNTGDFMYPHFIRICKLVLSQKDHKNTVVRSAVINLFPRLAKFNSSGFQEYCYSTCMTHLLEVLHAASSTTKSDALLSIGKLALAIGSSLTRDQRTISGILSAIKLGLKDGRKKDFDHHREALACLRMLADAVGPALVRFDLESILNLLFQQDLNAHLVETLTTIVKRIPSQKSVIQVRLFERLSHLLSGNDPLSSSSNSISSRSRAKTSVTSGSLLSIFSSAISQSKTSMLDGAISPSAFLNSSSDGAPTITSQALALETLANFDFQGNRHIPVMQFVHETVVKFLDHDVAMIRKSAALTCCKLVLPPGEVAPTTGEIARPVSAVLERLLTVGIADTEASIRSKVLGSLDFRFDPLLGQPDNLRCLFIALNDEIFDIRETAMMTLGRLTLANPSTVMPSLRQTLVQLLAELEFSGDSRGKEEGAMLIGCLLRSASHLAKPYVLPILKVLMKNLREDNDSTRRNRSTVSVSRAVLASLGDLADVGAEQLLPFLHQLLPEIIDEMKDLSNNVQVLQAAIRTIGQLISSTGYVVRPYHEYPELLDGLCQAIQKSGDSNESLRIEAGRTLGIIGALDPYSLRLLRLQKQGRINGSGGSTTTAAMRELQRLQARNFEASDSMDSNAVALANTDRRITSEMERNLFMMRSAMSSMMASTNKWESLVFGKNEESLLEAPFLIPRKRKEGQKDIQANNGNRGLGGILLVAPPEDLLPSFVGDSAHYFPTVAINALIRILLEPRNSVHYQGAILAIMYICKSLGKRIEPHLGQIIPAFLFTFEKVNPSLRKFLFEQLAGLIRIVEEKIQPHMDHMAFLAIIYGYWDEHLEEVLALVKELANSIGERFRVYMPDLIPQLLKVLRSERENQNRPRSLVVLKTIVSLGRLIDGYLHLIIPALVALIQSDADLNARKQALGSLGSLVKKLNVSVFASKIIHMLARVIATQQELVYLAMDCLSCMVYTMGEDYAIFVPVISQVIGRQQRTHDIFDRYDLLVSKILKYQPLPVASWATDPTKRSDIASDSKDTAQEEIKSLPINQNMLIKAWETTQRSTKEDWSEWMRAFSVELLRESPSPVLRACKELASVYQPLARELFNASFVSVWPHLSPPTQDNLIRALETAFQSAHLPSEILQTLLNLAEFMEHDNQSLPIDIRLLGSLAEKCHSFAKALHYKELEFNTNPTANGIQALISINSKLNQPEAARGILKYAQDHLRGVEVQASWHEKLLRWDDALKIYDKELEEDANNVEAIFGKIRCLYAIGEWRRLNDHVQDTWEKIYGHAPTAAGSSGSTGDHSSSITQQLELMEDKAIFLDVPPALKKELCSHAARVAFSLQHWELIPNYINADMDETESHLFKAVVNIRKMELEDALQEISECRKVMDPTLRSLVSESYTRAYLPSIVNLQVLAELEEIVRYLKLTVIPNASESHANTVRLDNKVEIGRHGSTTTMLVTSPNNTRSNMAIGGAFHDFERRQQFLRKLQQVWTKRMLGVERNIQVWQNLMLVRSLVLDPKEDIDIWLKYARLCRKNGHLNLAMSALWRVGAQPFIRSIQKDPLAPLSVNFNVPMGVTDSNTPDPRVAFSYLRHLWAENREDVALKQIIHFIEGLEQYANTPDGQVDEEARKLRVQVYIQLGEWQMSLLEPRKNTDGLFDQVLLCLETATCLDPSNHKAWHEWALMNFRALEATVKDQNDPNLVKRYAAPAINGFFRSISYGCKRYDVTKDVLRLLTLWFAQGHRSDVHNAMSEGFQEVSIDTWLDVIPQLIARIDSPNVKMNELLHELLSRIGFAHPQALIYPITVASKAVNVTRKSAAEGILAAVRRHSPVLVHEADMVSRELIRVAILWNELWYGALEEASKHFFNNRDPVAMLAELAPLHAQMEAIGQQEPPTLREVAFYQAFARDLRQAKAWTDVYEKTQCVDDLNQAWDIYYSVFSRIRKQLANLSTLELANVGPKLLSVHNLSLAVPGTYKAGAPIVRIKSFDQKVTVLTSKQRPRKVTINGSDGKSYPFLLKGHEDLRQDERVMQLFSVINTLLANDDDTSKRNLAIERYSVLPLSHTSGLIGWVPNCDTLHQLIRDYREARKIQLNVEHRLMVQMAPDYDKLPLMQKVEAFKYALGETTGQDLYRVLWLKSQDSEVWLDRRRNYTRSLAVMSMAGYILGLGDRHPSNLMLDRISGKIVHIDFGDCFEVAMERDKYPERVPFRLTRMLTQAMEVSGIEGNFRYTCEASMRVLRDNRDSLMAVLEAFVYDPLINWRLIKKDTVPSHAQPQSDRDAGTGAGTGDEDGKASDEAAVNKGRRGSTISNYRRRNSSADGMFSFTFESYNGAGAAVMRQMTRLPTTSESFAGMAHNSLEEAKLEYDTKNIGQSVIDLELPQLNEKALSVVDRVKKKLAGRDFDDGKKVLSVDAQVDRLIMQATSHENLCQLYYGWCPFW